VHFRTGRPGEGLLEMLTASLLEPKISLYQSYLGKAYYQLHRFAEATAAFESAKRLDPRDPTPWLYASFLLRDENRHQSFSSANSTTGRIRWRRTGSPRAT
jgi:tetratricopeptide (TPR) repeat protein